jgi:hypothetical protein
MQSKSARFVSRKRYFFMLFNLPFSSEADCTSHYYCVAIRCPANALYCCPCYNISRFRASSAGASLRYLLNLAPTPGPLLSWARCCTSAYKDL